MVKKISETAAVISTNQKPTQEQAEFLANQLADKPFGEPPKRIERVTISMDSGLYDTLYDLARERKRARHPNRSISSLIREFIDKGLADLPKF